MGGMGGALPGHAPVVDAFRSSLERQAVLVGVLLAIALGAWAISGVLFVPGSRRSGEPRSRLGEPSGRRALRLGFGVVWLVDGLLQLQGSMPLSMPTDVVLPAASGSPAWVHHLVNLGVSVWAHHPVPAATAAVWIQVGIGAMLVTTPPGWPSQLAGAVSVVWGLLVWAFGEAFGGVFAPGLSWMFGAPGAVLVYVAAGLLIALPVGLWAGRRLGRSVMIATGLYFVGAAVLQAWPGRGFWQGQPTPQAAAGQLTSMVKAMSETPQPAALSRLLTDFGSFDAAHGWGVNLAVVVLLAAVGLGLLSGRRRIALAAVGLGTVLCLADWVLVQDLGFLGGVGTDPNSMVPTVLVLCGGYLAWTRASPGAALSTAPAGVAADGVHRPRLLPVVAGPASALSALGVVLVGAVPMASAAINGRTVPGLDLMTHWAITPLGVAAVLALGAHEAGLWRLSARSPMPRPSRVRRAWTFRGGIALVLLATASPMAYWGMRSLSVHMVDHLLLMCFAPAALVASGPVIPLCWALPLRSRYRVLRWLRSSGPGACLRAAWGFATRPLAGFVALNTAMLAWHLPRAFDAAMSSPTVHGLLMEPSFLIAGLLFWRSVLPSYPYAPRARLRAQFLMVVATNFEMVLLAMALSIFTTHAWYVMGTGMSPATSPAAAFSAQQTAAAILWICGDFWALPAVVLIVQRVIKRDGSFLTALERSFSAGQAPDQGPASALSSSSST